MSKKISELTETIEPTTNDVFPIVSNGETKKSTLLNIINTIKTVLNNVYASITHTHTKSEITDFPNNLSEFNNDSGFLSEEGDPTVPAHVKNITEENISAWNNKSDFSGNYEDLNNKPNEYELPKASSTTLGGIKVGANLSISEDGTLNATGGGGEGGTTDYNALSNKPQINGVELTGNKTSAELGVASASHTHAKSEIADFPSNLSEFNNDSGFISSTVVTTFWTGTQAEYDALGTYNATTLYLITE